MEKIRPWWRCSGCKQVYKVNLPGSEDIPRPPEEQIPEVGICVACHIKPEGEYQKRRRTMAKQKAPRDHPSEIHDPYYRENLENAVRRAKDLLWQRLQHGAYQDDVEARATMDAYWALKKVQQLLAGKIRQVPLFTPPSDEDYLKQRNLLGKEVSGDPTPRA